jgi:hypothetical protein
MSSLFAHPPQDFNDADTPPVFRTWNGWYSLVIGVFAAIVLLLWAFSQAFQ